MYTTIAETNDYAIKTSNDNDTGIIVRKMDNHFCYLSDVDTNVLIEHIDDINDFTIMCNSFTYIDPQTEKEGYDKRK